MVVVCVFRGSPTLTLLRNDLVSRDCQATAISKLSFLEDFHAFRGVIDFNASSPERSAQPRFKPTARNEVVNHTDCVLSFGALAST